MSERESGKDKQPRQHFLTRRSALLTLGGTADAGVQRRYQHHAGVLSAGDGLYRRHRRRTYSSHGANSTTNAVDRVYTTQTGGKMELTLSGDATSGYTASVTIGLPITATT